MGFSVTTVNTHGMSQQVRAKHIQDYLDFHGIDLAFLQETNMTMEKQQTSFFFGKHSATSFHSSPYHICLQASEWQ